MGEAKTKSNIALGFTRYWPFTVLFAVWLIFSSPYVFGGLVPFPSKYLVTFFPPWSATYAMPVKNNAMPDVIGQIYPWKNLTTKTWASYQFPLWNPYDFSGTAHAANYQSAVFSPINLLFFILPRIHAWSVMILLQPLLAGLFMYLFLRSLTLSKMGSLFGAGAFMFCGFIVVWMAYGTLSYAALFLPLILFAINRYTQTSRVVYGVLAAVGVALSFLSGHFQISLYVLGYAFLYTIFLVLVYKRHNATMGFVYMMLGVLFCAPQLMLTMSAYNNAVRSSLFLKGEIIPWQYLVTLFAPDFYGNPVTRNDWFGHYAEWSGFIGVLPLCMTPFAWVVKSGRKTVSFLFCMALGTLLFALPTPLTAAMYALHIPVLSTSAAARIIILTSFSLAALSGYGLDAIAEVLRSHNIRVFMRWAITLVLMVTSVWIVLRYMKPLPHEALTIAMRNSILPSVIIIISVVVGGVALVLPKKYVFVAVYVFLAISLFDLYHFASKWMPFDPPSFMYPKTDVITFLQSQTRVSQARVFGNFGNEVADIFNIASIEGYDAVYQARYGQFISAVQTGTPNTPDRSVVVFPKHGKFSESILRLLGVKYVLHRKSDGRFVWAYPFWDYAGYHLVWNDAAYEVYENDNAYPRAFLASSYRIESDDAATLSRLFSENFDRRNSVVLEERPAFEPTIGEGTVQIVRYEPDRVDFTVTTSVPKLLFISDVYDSGWHAAIDGRATKIYRADYDFRAVSVPAGNHAITMWYWPGELTSGLVISGLATVCCIVLFVSEKYENWPI